MFKIYLGREPARCTCGGTVPCRAAFLDAMLARGLPSLGQAEGFAMLHAGWTLGMRSPEEVPSIETVLVEHRNRAFAPTGEGVWTTTICGLDYTIRQVAA